MEWSVAAEQEQDKRGCEQLLKGYIALLRMSLYIYRSMQPISLINQHTSLIQKDSELESMTKILTFIASGRFKHGIPL